MSDEAKPKKKRKGLWWKIPVSFLSIVVGLLGVLYGVGTVNDHDAPKVLTTTKAPDDISTQTADTKAADTRSAPKSVPKPVDVADATETANKACERITSEIVNLSKRGQNPSQPSIVKLYDVKAHEPPPNEPNKIYMAFCTATAMVSSGIRGEIFFYMVKDSDGDRFVGYNERY